MAIGFEVLIGNLNTLGFYDFFFPFIFFLAVIYGLLQKSVPFSKETGINATISLVVSFFIVNYTPIGIFMANFFANSGALIALAVMIIIFAQIMGVNLQEVVQGNPRGALLIVAFFGIILFVASGGLYFFNNAMNIRGAMIFLVFALVALVGLMGSR